MNTYEQILEHRKAILRQRQDLATDPIEPVGGPLGTIAEAGLVLCNEAAQPVLTETDLEDIERAVRAISELLQNNLELIARRDTEDIQ